MLLTFIVYLWIECWWNTWKAYLKKEVYRLTFEPLKIALKVTYQPHSWRRLKTSRPLPIRSSVLLISWYKIITYQILLHCTCLQQLPLTEMLRHYIFHYHIFMEWFACLIWYSKNSLIVGTTIENRLASLYTFETD